MLNSVISTSDLLVLYEAPNHTTLLIRKLELISILIGAPATYFTITEGLYTSFLVSSMAPPPERM